MATVTFQTKNKTAVVYDYSKDSGFYLVWLHSNCANPKRLAEYRIKSIDGIKSLTALIRACEDPSNQFCPHSVSCDTPFKKTDSQDGGNLSPPPVSSTSPATGGNLLHTTIIKNNSIKFLNAGGSVLAIIMLYGDKYTYHLPFDAYYRIKRLSDDCQTLHGYPMGIKRYAKLCKKYSHDRQNLNVSVA